MPTPTHPPTSAHAPNATADVARSSDPSPIGRVVVVGAGPAGLTAAYELTKSGVGATVLEAGDVVGGISQTPVRNGWRFDIGGHRFFTKVPEVAALWREILPDDLLVRPRLSRIYYRGKFFDYPIRPLNALRNLGLVEAVRCVLSFLAAKVRPPRPIETLEDYIVANYGRRLYEHFFASYNLKVWGVPASALSADWGAQRIRGMSLWAAVWEPIRRTVLGARRPEHEVTSLIERFEYPRLGPGQMWERCAVLATDGGAELHLRQRVVRLERDACGVHTVVVEGDHGGAHGQDEFGAEHLVSSMPINHLVESFDPPAPDDVRRAASALRHRDFLTVAVVVPDRVGFPDNWIYIHSPDVAVGRIQNFGSWSPDMVHGESTCLGLEYFASIGDELWESSDEELRQRAADELVALGLASPADIGDSWVVRMPRAYPVYDADYEANVSVIRRWLQDDVPNVHPVGRNGMHRYNNQDHSMLTAMRTVENLLGAEHDIWAINVDDDYHEDGPAADGPDHRGGRAAPVLPDPAGVRVSADGRASPPHAGVPSETRSPTW